MVKNINEILEEARELAPKVHKLSDFMRTQDFSNLDRVNKDLLYEQHQIMNNYLQVLGKRLEVLGSKFTFEK